MQTLIIYYSLTENCDFVAQEIQKNLGKADLLRLKPKNDIKSKGVMRMFWGGKQVMTGEAPELEKYDVDFAKYDRFVIGTPVWAWTFAPALKTFFAKEKLPKKPVALFACHGGGPGKTLEKMKAELEGCEIFAELEIKEPLKDKEKSVEKIRAWTSEF